MEKSNNVVNVLSSVNRLAGKLRKDIRSARYVLGEKLPTERDLAQESGLSRGTVRKALDILEAERLVVCQHGRGTFVANPVHTRLKSTKNTLIAIMTFERKYYFEPIIQTASAQSSKQGYAMVIGMNNTYELESQHIDSFISNGIQGVIMTPRSEFSKEGYQRLVNEKIPVVFLDSLLPDCDEDYVVVDNRQGTMLATKYLYQLGHRRIAYIGHNGLFDIPCRQERLRGYLEACRDLGLRVHDDWVIESNSRERVSRVSELLRRSDHPTAFVAYNDTWAISVIRIAQELGLEVPDDLSVTGFDDSVVASGYEIPITSINPEYTEIGITAVNMLIEKIENQRIRPKKGIYINPKIVLRKSTGKPSKKKGKL